MIPAYNPDETLLDEIAHLKKRGVRYFVVVNDGSDPASNDVFRQVEQTEGCVLLTHAVNLGEGRALKTAFNYLLVSRRHSLGCVTTDCWESCLADDVVRVMNRLSADDNTFILGKRQVTRGSQTLGSLIGNKIVHLSFHFLIEIEVNDAQCVLRGIPSSYLKSLLTIAPDRYEYEMEMLIGTEKAKIPLEELQLQSEYKPWRSHPKMRPFKDYYPIYRTFAKYIFTSVIASGIDLLLFTIFCHMLNDVGIFSKMQLYIVAATVMARIISASISYKLNYQVVFKAQNGGKGVAGWIILNAIQMGLSALAVSLIHGFFGGPETLIKWPVDIALFFLGYFVSKKFIYAQ